MRYAIVEIEDAKKPVFVKITKLEDGTSDFFGIPEDIQNETSVATRYSRKHVLAWFHKKPRFGKVFNTSTRILYKKEKEKGIGLVFYSRDTGETEDKIIKRIFRWVREELPSELFVDILPCAVNILPNDSKTEGMWKTGGYKPNECGMISFMPKIIEYNSGKHIFAHELAHPIWDRLDSEQKAKWIRAYQASFTISKASEEQIESMRKDLVEAGSCKELARGLDKEADEYVLWKSILTYLSKVRRLNPEYINVLMGAGNDLTGVWPTSAIDLSKVYPILTEYSVKNPCEFFCEAFALYYTGKEIPKNLRKMIKRL